MKHKRFDKRRWHRVSKVEQRILEMESGVLVDAHLLEVTQPFDAPFAGCILRLLDNGYRWVYFQPHQPRHALTVMLDAAGRPVQLYADTALGGGLDPDGVPYITDAYLDVLAVCGSDWQVTETWLKDVDEWHTAKETGELSASQAARAWAEAEAITQALRAGDFTSLATIREYLQHAPYTP